MERSILEMALEPGYQGELVEFDWLAVAVEKEETPSFGLREEDTKFSFRFMNCDVSVSYVSGHIQKVFLELDLRVISIYLYVKPWEWVKLLRKCAKNVHWLPLLFLRAQQFRYLKGQCVQCHFLSGSGGQTFLYGYSSFWTLQAVTFCYYNLISISWSILVFRMMWTDVILTA